MGHVAANCHARDGSKQSLSQAHRFVDIASLSQVGVQKRCQTAPAGIRISGMDVLWIGGIGLP